MIRLFVCGDVMTGRGIDQIMPYPSNPKIYESYVKDAREYVKLAESKNGPIPKPVSFDYIWGDALPHLNRFAPDLRIINLETSITTSEEYWKGKEINYRMNPKNTPCLTAAKIDYCSLANNHVLDWGYSGLRETLDTLAKAHINSSGAGENIEAAQSPAIMEVKDKGRIVVFSVGSRTSGVPADWVATKDSPGINLLKDTSSNEIGHISEMVNCVKMRNDFVVVSIHWGSNWGYDISEEERQFAHKLVDKAGVDLIYGHSSHHTKGVEVYKNKLVLYGCGDFLNDYEGISGYEFFRGDLGLMYFASVEPSSGELVSLEMIPIQIKRFRVNNLLDSADTEWFRNVLNLQSQKFGTSIELVDNIFRLDLS